MRSRRARLRFAVRKPFCNKKLSSYNDFSANGELWVDWLSQPRGPPPTASRSDLVFVHEGDCNEVLLAEVFPRARFEDRHRALCLLDPYNIDLSWDVVQTAGRMRSIEIFLNFMVMDMNMNVLLRHPAKANPTQRRRMNRFWGDDSWRRVTYEENPQGHLFQESETIKVTRANERIAEAYRERLLSIAGFQHVPRPLPFVNRQGATVYYLFFASPNQTANKIVEQIFEKHRQLQGL